MGSLVIQVPVVSCVMFVEKIILDTFMPETLLKYMLKLAGKNKKEVMAEIKSKYKNLKELMEDMK